MTHQSVQNAWNTTLVLNLPPTYSASSVMYNMKEK